MAHAASQARRGWGLERVCHVAHHWDGSACIAGIPACLAGSRASRSPFQPHFGSGPWLASEPPLNSGPVRRKRTIRHLRTGRGSMGVSML